MFFMSCYKRSPETNAATTNPGFPSSANPMYAAPVSYYTAQYNANHMMPFYYPSYGWNSYPPLNISGGWQNWPAANIVYPVQNYQAQQYYPTSGAQGQTTSGFSVESAPVVEEPPTTSYQDQSVSTIHSQTNYQSVEHSGQQYYGDGQDQFHGEKQPGSYQDQQVAASQEEMSGYMYPHQEQEPSTYNGQSSDYQVFSNILHIS
jgi:hypothetical protein